MTDTPIIECEPPFDPVAFCGGAIETPPLRCACRHDWFRSFRPDGPPPSALHPELPARSSTSQLFAAARPVTWWLKLNRTNVNQMQAAFGTIEGADFRRILEMCLWAVHRLCGASWYETDGEPSVYFRVGGPATQARCRGTYYDRGPVWVDFPGYFTRPDSYRPYFASLPHVCNVLLHEMWGHALAEFGLPKGWDRHSDDPYSIVARRPHGPITPFYPTRDGRQKWGHSNAEAVILQRWFGPPRFTS